MHKAILMNREEDIFPFNKLLKFTKKQFRKEDSLFAEVQSKNDNCYSYDKDLWRLDEKIIRSAALRQDLDSYLTNNYPRLQKIQNFFRAMGGNNGWIESEFCRQIMRQCNLASESNKRVVGKINMEDVDRFMIAAKFIDV